MTSTFFDSIRVINDYLFIIIIIVLLYCFKLHYDKNIYIKRKKLKECGIEVLDDLHNIDEFNNNHNKDKTIKNKYYKEDNRRNQVNNIDSNLLELKNQFNKECLGKHNNYSNSKINPINNNPININANTNFKANVTYISPIKRRLNPNNYPAFLNSLFKCTSHEGYKIFK